MPNTRKDMGLPTSSTATVVAHRDSIVIMASKPLGIWAQFPLKILPDVTAKWIDAHQTRVNTGAQA